MAKHVILESYTFTPGSKSVVVNGKAIRKEQLVLITNVTTNTVLYNFADSSLGATLTISTSGNVETTSILLTANTNLFSGMNTSDKLAILVDETNESFFPAESYRDPVEKLRTSTPQALIDTDFEYGVQATKWETVALMNNRPSAFYDSTQGISGISQTLTLPNTAPGAYQITGIAGNGTRLVTISINNTSGITTSTPIYIQDSTDQNANGWYLPSAVTTNASVTYYARGNVTNGNIFDTTKSYIFVGAFYTGSAIPAGTGAITVSGTILTVTTTHAHGLTAGQAVYIVGTSSTGGNANGAWYVRTTPTSNSFTIDTTGGTSGTPTGTVTALLNASVYPRTWGTSIHRAYDGGVTFTAGYPYHGNQLIRQTRRYFRYQSGKGIQFSTGANMCSSLQVDSLSSVADVVTVTTKYVHNLGIGARIKVSGADGAGQGAFNGTGDGTYYTVLSIPNDTSFTYRANASLGTTNATSTTGYTVQPYQWYGAALRIGMFDSQNGMFFEYDGQTLYAVRRNSTTQLPGYLTSLTNGSQACTGTNTKWSETLIPGDFIVIRGMTYTIVSIESNTSMTIYPDYRGTTISSPSQVIVNRVVEYKVPQSQWNIDKLDGTGASNFVLDITKMQMWFIDYAWYGAGTIRFGIRNQRGEVIYAHRIAHGNNVTEAYLRSGNLPARYEVNTFYPKTILSAGVGIPDTTINVKDTTGFPTAGNLILTASGNTGAAIEYVAYTGKTSTSFTGVTRGLSNLTGPGSQSSMGGASASAFTYSATAPVSVAFWGPQAACTIGHWGSSVIMDGRYDDDKSFQFNYGQSSPVTYATAGTTYPIFSIRLSPSVDSGLTGLLGQREILNRMQLQPVGMGVYTQTAGVKVEVWLNARVVGGANFAPVGGSSLAQYAQHANTGVSIQGGERIYTYFAPAGGVSTQDLSRIRDIGNSILGGGTSLSSPTTDANKYPDGPDVITVSVTPLAANALVAARMNWTEAQA